METRHIGSALGVLLGIALQLTLAVPGEAQTPASAAAAAPASGGASETLEATDTRSDGTVRSRLRSRVQERWRVVPTREGFVLVPRRAVSDVAGVELVRDQILLAGQPVSGAELRARLGADAETILALSYLDDEARQALFAPADRREPTVTARAEAAVPQRDESRRTVLRRHGARVRLGSDLVVGEGERVEDAAVAIFGSVLVDGEVGGDVVTIGGDVRLGPRAVVRGSVTAVGGQIHAHPEARLLGGSNDVALAWPGDWEAIRVGPDVRVRLFPDRQWWASAAFVGTTVRLALIGLLGLIAVLLGGRLFQRASDQIRDTPWQSVIVGIGAQLVLGPLVLLLCVALLVSVVGIPVLALMPLALLLMAGVWLVGVAAVLERLGQLLFRVVFSGGVPAPLAFGGGFLCVAALVWPVRAAWWMGGVGFGSALALGLAGALIEGLVWAAGLGALILAWLNRRATQPLAAPPPLTPVHEGPSAP